MDKKLVKKSCKVCSALLIGVILGYGLSKLLEGDTEKEDTQSSCGCSS